MVLMLRQLPIFQKQLMQGSGMGNNNFKLRDHCCELSYCESSGYLIKQNGRFSRQVKPTERTTNGRPH